MDEDLRLLLNPREADCKDVTDHSHEHTDHTHEHEHAHSKCSECCDHSHYNKEQTEDAPDLFVQSTFDLSVIFEESSKDDWGKIGEVIKSCLDLKFKGNQVHNVTINEQILHVDHNFPHMTAQDLVDALFGFCYEVTIISDGGTVAEDHSHAHSHQDSTESLKEHDHSHEHSGDHDHDHW